MKRTLTCIVCPVGCTLEAELEGGKVVSVSGNTCPRGPKYAADEVTAPKRMLTTTVAVEGGLLPLLPVVSSTVLPKEKVLACAAYLRGVKVQAPIAAGDVVDVEGFLYWYEGMNPHITSITVISFRFSIHYRSEATDFSNVILPLWVNTGGVILFSEEYFYNL